MVVVFLCIYCTKIVHDNKLFPTRKHLILHACAVDSFRYQHFWNGGDFCLLFSMYQTKVDAKMTKSKWNYKVNMIMNVSGTVCQHIHYSPGKQWLANDPTWPALKVNNARGFDISLSVWIYFLFFYFQRIWPNLTRKLPKWNKIISWWYCRNTSNLEISKPCALFTLRAGHVRSIANHCLPGK